MSEEDRDAADWFDAIEIDPESIEFDGDPGEALAAIDTRIEELQEAREDLDKRDPQYGLVRFELRTLSAIREGLWERLDVDDQEADRDE